MPYKPGTTVPGTTIGALDKDMKVTVNPPSLESRIQWLKSHPSPDAVQQMQSAAIIELYEVVKQIQLAMAGTAPLLLPNVSAVREAAAKAAEGSLKSSALRKP